TKERGLVELIPAQLQKPLCCFGRGFGWPLLRATCEAREDDHEPESLLETATVHNLLCAARDNGVIDPHRHGGLFIFSWSAIDRVHHFHPPGDAPQSRERSVQIRALANHNKEMRGAANRFLCPSHRDDAAFVL